MRAATSDNSRTASVEGICPEKPEPVDAGRRTGQWWKQALNAMVILFPGRLPLH